MQINPKKIINSNNYVVCLNTWQDDKGKYKKVPVPPHNRHATKESGDWEVMRDGKTRFPLSYEEALFLAQLWNLEDNNEPTKYYGIGIGLSGDNGLFCIDLDGFDKLPEYIEKNFQGCFVEHSVSGNGFHIFGILADGERVPEHNQSSKRVLGVEFYSKRRFIALGSPLGGEISIVEPEKLQAFLEYYGLIADTDEGEMPADEALWTNKPYPDYYPGELQTDEQLIEYLLDHKSAKEQLSYLTQGHKDISFNARWSAPHLCVNDANGFSPYPSCSEVYQSVFVDLLWVFGGNCQRVYECVVANPFFYRTDKPHKWTIRSIQNALDALLARPVGSRFLAFKQAVAKAEAERVAEVLDETGYSDDDTITEQLTLEEMLTRYVHIANGNYVLDKKSRTTLKFGDLKSLMAGNVTFLESEKTNALGVKQKSKSAVETLDLWKKDNKKISVFSTTFEPIPHQYVAGEKGLKLFNLYEPVLIRESDGDYDISYFHEHIKALFHERADEFLDWCAHMVQKPHELPHQHWYHVSEKGGTGRGSLCGLLSAVSGYGRGIALDVLFNSQFNEWRKKLIFGFVEEMGEDNASGDKKAIYRKFKEFSSADEIRFNDKGDKAVYVKNFSRWLLCANEINQVEITREDRRLNVVIRTRDECNFKVANGHLKTVYKNPKFIASVRHYLAHRDIEGYMPQSDAKLESDKLMAIAACARNSHYASTSEFGDPEALAELTSDVEDFIKNYEGPDILSLKCIIACVRPNDPMAPSGQLGKYLINILKRIGCFYTAHHRFFVALTPNSEKKSQTHVWILRNVGKWRKLLDIPWQIRAELEKPIRYNAMKQLEVEGNKITIHNPAERMQ